MPERLNPDEPSAPDAPLDPAAAAPCPLSPEQVNITDPPSVRHHGDSVTTGSLPPVVDDARVDDARLARPRRVREPLGRWLAIYAAGAVALGSLAGLLWFLLVPLSTYRVNAEGYATTTERGLAGFVAGDAWFVLIGVVLGIVCGAVAWWWFAGLGWPALVLALTAATVMGLVCWLVGWLLGPGPIAGRLATATPGQTLPIELTVRGPAALLVWPFGAALVIMLTSTLERDPDDLGWDRQNATA